MNKWTGSEVFGMKYDPHNHAGQLQGVIRKLESNEYDILEENRKRILVYYRELVSEGYSAARILKHIYLLKQITKKINRPFERLTKEEIRDFIVQVESNPRLSEWSKHDYKVVLRCFFRWLKGSGESLPEEVSWIKIHVKERHKMPEDLLTEEEVGKIVSATSNPRDRTLIQCLFETGCRISELLTIQLKNIKFDEYGAVLIVSGKTGTRRIRIIASVPTLSTWLNLHPFRDNPEAYLFVRNKSKRNTTPIPFAYNHALQIVKGLAAAAGIKKRVHPHLFRHSRATALANKLTEAQMKEYFGWVQGSNIASIYVHLSGRDVDDAILSLHGMKAEQQKERDGFKVVGCSQCSTKNAPGAQLCMKCGHTLGAGIGVQQESEPKQMGMMSEPLKDPEVRELLLKKMMEMGIR
jgi:integrase